MRKALLNDQAGVAMVMVLAVAALLVVLAVGFIDVITRETIASGQAVKRDAAFQAAEGGIDRYVAKLMQDSQYELHYVDPAESTRRTTGGTLVSAGQPCDSVASALSWSSGVSWSYPNGKDHWCPLTNGYDYNLQVGAPTQSNAAVTITATGRPHLDTNTAHWRTIEARVRPSSISDFQMLANANISYGSSATTTGKIYAGINSSGVAMTVTHNGTASADLFGEGGVSGSTTLTNGARTYGPSTIRSVIPTPVNFNGFLGSLVKVQTAAQYNGGLYLSNTSVDGWALTFQSGGTVLVQGCTKKIVSGTARDIADQTPNCNAATVYPVPANGAIYAVQSVIVSGQVNGRVTVASNNNIVVGDNIYYLQPGDDVLGLVAANDVIIAHWVPYDLTWSAATISQSGKFRSYNSDGSKGTMTFNGSTATADGGYMTMFQSRIYNYDSNLLYVQPPWFPTLGDAYTILLQRELRATS